MSLKIRPMDPKDKPVIMRLLRAIPEFEPDEVTVAEEVIDSYLRDPVGSGYLIVVAEDPEIVGYVCYGPTPLTHGTWDLYWIAVSPENQGHGIGKALMLYVEDRIETARGRLVLIETSSKADYEKTRGFYQARGYAEACRIQDFYAPGDDKVVLQKKLR